jgi:hypothetical protein
MPRTLWTEEQLTILRDMVLSGASIARCAAKYNRTRQSIRAAAKRAGVTFPRPSELSARNREKEKLPIK